jgi:hypothetical protein
VYSGGFYGSPTCYNESIVESTDLSGWIQCLEVRLFVRKENYMKLSKPKVVTWWIAVIAGVLGILGALVKIPIVSPIAIWFIAFAFVLLALATFFKNL